MRSDGKNINRWNIPLSSLLSLFLLFFLTIILVCKVYLSLTRQFDPDELSYLHWSFLLTQGYLPYRDFFFYITPLYPAFLMPLFLLPQGPAIALGGRILMMIVYLITLFLIFLLAKKYTKHTTIALLTLLCFAAFPITFDKTIEIRPDILMTACFLGSVYTLINKRYILSGMFLMLSILVLPKIVFAIPAFLFLLIISLGKEKKRVLIPWIIGCTLPLALYGLWLWYTDLFFACIHALTYDAFIANVGNTTFSLLATLSPWPLVYVKTGGISFPWGISTLLWLLTLPGIIVLIKQHRTIGVFLGILAFSSICFLMLFPKPYVQYFIIPSWIAAGCTAFLIALLQKHRWWFEITSICIALSLFISFMLQYQSRQEAMFTNQEQLQVLRDIPKFIQPEEPVYDMVGSYIFRPDGYFICCHPYIQFSHAVQPPLPTLQESLIKTQTKFLVLDQKGYVFWITAPHDLSFLLRHYLPSKYNKVYSLGFHYVCVRGNCIQYTLHGSPINTSIQTTIDLVIPETYRITLVPNHASVTLNGKQYHDGDHIWLEPQSLPFTVSYDTTALILQLDR